MEPCDATISSRSQIKSFNLKKQLQIWKLQHIFNNRQNKQVKLNTNNPVKTTLSWAVDQQTFFWKDKLNSQAPFTDQLLPDWTFSCNIAWTKVVIISLARRQNSSNINDNNMCVLTQFGRAGAWKLGALLAACHPFPVCYLLFRLFISLQVLKGLFFWMKKCSYIHLVRFNLKKLTNSLEGSCHCLNTVQRSGSNIHV